ncbi:hypothetical protein ACTG9Q_06030 [Actinokineospora sp. 24-640]
MTNAPLSISEKSALLALMILGQKASNPEIQDFCGFTIDKPVRVVLVERKLIEAEQSKAHRGAFVHELTEKGWQRCREQFADEMPPGGQKKDRILYRLAQWTGRLMDRTETTFADLTDVDEPAAVKPSPTTVDERVIAAYQDLATGPDAWIGLVELREALPDLARAELDEALHRIAELPQVYFTPEVNQKTLTDADREAALYLGGEHKHFLSVESS